MFTKLRKSKRYHSVCGKIYTNLLSSKVVIYLIKSRSKQKISLRAGFEPAREYPNRFQVCRLNHSAITAHTQSRKILNID